MNLTDHQRDNFARDGYLVLPEHVPGPIVARLQAEADRVLRDALNRMQRTHTADPRVTWWRLTSGRPYVLKVKPILDMAPAASAIATGLDLSELAANLLSAQPQVMEDKFMYKQEVDLVAGWAGLPVLGEEVCKHTDAAYFRTRGHDRVLTVAVCLDECTPAAGALRVWPGTHRREIEQIKTPNQGPVVPDHAAPDSDAVTLTAPAGSILAWDAALVHASDPNTSGHPRRLLVLGYAAHDESER
jgi:hypothetical protein